MRSKVSNDGRIALSTIPIQTMQATKAAILTLQDGTTFRGYSFGYDGPAAGEVVFNTAMTGYPESLTDPSYEGQILVTTFPQLGNYGVPPSGGEDTLDGYMESTRIHLSLIHISEPTRRP